MSKGIILFEKFIKIYHPSEIKPNTAFCKGTPCSTCLFENICYKFDLLTVEETETIKMKYPEYFV